MATPYDPGGYNPYNMWAQQFGYGMPNVWREAGKWTSPAAKGEVGYNWNYDPQTQTFGNVLGQKSGVSWEQIPENIRNIVQQKGWYGGLNQARQGTPQGYTTPPSYRSTYGGYGMPQGMYTTPPQYRGGYGGYPTMGGGGYGGYPTMGGGGYPPGFGSSIYPWGWGGGGFGGYPQGMYTTPPSYRSTYGGYGGYGGAPAYRTGPQYGFTPPTSMWGVPYGGATGTNLGAGTGMGYQMPTPPAYDRSSMGMMGVQQNPLTAPPGGWGGIGMPRLGGGAWG